MMKLLRVALLGGVLLLAGCGPVEPRPPTVPQPSEPAVGAAEGQSRQVPPGWEEALFDKVSAPQARADEDGAAGVEAAEAVPETPGGGVQDVGQAENLAPVQAEPVEADPPGQGPRQEADEAEPAEPNVVTAAPPEPNEAAASLFHEFAEILATYVREDGRVDYGGLRRRRLDLKPLLMKLGELDPNVYERWPRDEKLAFWINAYNLKMLEIITRNYPIQSSWWLRLTWPPDDIRHIRGIWTEYKFIVMEEEYTLGAVERRVFQKTFEDPRIFLALTYASQSSPLLRRRPYGGADLDRQLDEQVRSFLASPRGFQIDRRNMVVRLSALFKPAWRGKEFVRRFGTDKKFKDQDPETRAVLSFIAGYLSREDVYFLEVENYALEYMNFDWRLNDTARGY